MILIEGYYKQLFNLSSRFDPLGDAATDNDPGKDDTQYQLPLYGAQIIKAGGDPQHVVTEMMSDHLVT